MYTLVSKHFNNVRTVLLYVQEDSLNSWIASESVPCGVSRMLGGGGVCVGGGGGRGGAGQNGRACRGVIILPSNGAIRY